MSTTAQNSHMQYYIWYKTWLLCKISYGIWLPSVNPEQETDDFGI